VIAPRERLLDLSSIRKPRQNARSNMIRAYGELREPRELHLERPA